ncbi:MAG: hypothetical protein IT177_21595 [Acidobacteria bacterium]|nr:hypothetical protein [Acidobacteriota bacterium]
MTVYILIREDQNEHGFVDTSIDGVFGDEHVARQQEAHERQRAHAEGLIVEDEHSPDGEWQVSWLVAEHVVG